MKLTLDNTETSHEILDAIIVLAGGNVPEAYAIWNDPEREELLTIWQRVTHNGTLPAAQFCWGSSGRRWAMSIEHAL